MYKVEFSDSAAKDFQTIRVADRRLWDRILTAVRDLARDPFQGKKLRWEFKGRYSLRVGSYRVIYSVYKERLVVFIIDLGHRREIYR